MMRLRSIAMLRWFPPAVLALAGCGDNPPPRPPEKPFAGLKLVVAVVDDPALLPSIKAQRGEWAARTGADLTILDEPVAPDALANSNVDVLVFPGDRMGDLVDVKALAVLPDSAVLPPEPTAEGSGPAPEPPPDDLKYKDIVLAYRDQVTRYGTDRMALPIGGSALMVAFHRAAFDGPANKEAAKGLGLALEPPKTWEQFDALARFFQGRDWDGDGSPESGVALAWAADPRGGRRRHAPGQGRRARPAPRPVLVPDRLRDDRPEGRRAPVRRGPEGVRRLEGLRPPGGREVRCRRRAPGVPIRRGRPADRPSRAGRRLGRDRHPDRHRPPARLAPRVQLPRQRLGRPEGPEPAELPAPRGRLAGRGRRLEPAEARGRGLRPGTSPAPTRPTASGPRRASRCSPSGRRN